MPSIVHEHWNASGKADKESVTMPMDLLVRVKIDVGHVSTRQTQIALARLF